MKSIDVLGSDSSKTALLPCEITCQANLLNSQFFKICSNFKLNSVFKTPNVKSHNKEDFYVNFIFKVKIDTKTHPIKTFQVLIFRFLLFKYFVLLNFHKNALSTVEMFDENKFVCLLNDCFVDAKSSFSEVKSKIDKRILENNENQANKYEYTATLMENLVCVT